MSVRARLVRARRYWSAVILAASLFCLESSVSAQGFHCHTNGQDGPISTERTTFTNSTTVVPCHALQIESGLLASSKQKQWGYDAPESLLRYGLSDKTELRFAAPDYFQNDYNTGRFVSGLGDLGLGVKQALAATNSGFNLAAIAVVSLPTGANAASSHGYDPTMQLMGSQALPANVTLSGMLSFVSQTVGSVRSATGQSSAQCDWQFRKSADAVAEYSGFFPQAAKPQHYVDFGGLYRPTPHQQWDVRAGFGVSAAATDRFFGVGYSVRFGL